MSSTEEPARAPKWRAAFARPGGGWVAATFIVSRLAFHLAGVRFDTTPLRWYWQFLDPELLRHDLLRSLWDLHTQPPLFNLFLGLVLKGAGSHTASVFQTLFLAISLAGLLALRRLLVLAGASPWCALLLSTGVGLTPGWVLQENRLFYDVPVAVLLIAVCLAFALHLERPSSGAFLLGGMLLALVFSRSLFHLGWLASLFACLPAVDAPLRKRLGGILASVLLLTSLLYIKNAVRFGSFTASSFTGMNLAHFTFETVSTTERIRLHEEGHLSAFSLVMPFSSVEEYARFDPLLLDPGLFRGRPALESARKSNGERNLNHIGFLRVSQACGRDALGLLVSRPWLAAEDAAVALTWFFEPSSVEARLEGNRAALGPWDRLFSHAPLIALLSVSAVAFGVRETWRARDACRRGLLAFLLVTTCWVVAVGVLTEVGENYRFRFLLGPIFAIFLAEPLDAFLARFSAPTGAPSA